MSGVHSRRAPAPVGPYPHARRVGDFLFISGMGPRQPGTDAIPGRPTRDADGVARDICDVTCVLIDMDRDFAAFYEAYGVHFGTVRPTRTTVAIRALPTPIAVELKAIAYLGASG